MRPGSRNVIISGRLNFLKICSEAQLFGILVLCLVIQTAEVGLGLGRIVASHCRSSTSYQIYRQLGRRCF